MKASQHPEAAFLAAMTASATHEVRNVLAIIKESAGLVEDLVRVFGQRGTLNEEKISQAVGRIEAQVKRGADLLTNLNRLSHTLDQDLDRVELAREAEQVVFLSQRFARKGGHQVRLGEADPGCQATVNPIRLHMTLFAAMECCLEELPEGSTVTVVVRKGQGEEVVEYLGSWEGAGEAAMPSEFEGWSDVARLAESLGASVHRAVAGYGIRILFPRSPWTDTATARLGGVETT